MKIRVLLYACINMELKAKWEIAIKNERERMLNWNDVM